MQNVQNNGLSNVNFGANLKFSGELKKEYAEKLAAIGKRFEMRTGKYPDEEVEIVFRTSPFYDGHMQTSKSKLSLGGINKWFKKITVEEFADNLAILFKLEKKLINIRSKKERFEQAFVENRHEYDRLNTIIKTHRGNSNASKQAKAMKAQVKLQAKEFREKIMLYTQKFKEVKCEMWDYADEYTRFGISQLFTNIKL